MGERCNRTAEVRGSNPLSSTKKVNVIPGEYILEWFDSPEYPAFKSRPQDIAVPHPEFRVSGK